MTDTAGMRRGEGHLPHVVGHYRVVREIGRGATAVVYLAREERHGRNVAIKVLRPEAASALSMERFQREIAIVARLQHPHILPLHDSGDADGLLYYVMPYVEGQSLRDLLSSGGPLPVGDAVSIARDVADALDYAHARGLVHRDIKPENILLSSGRAVVADFGLGRAMEAATTAALTESGVVVGTPAYMSPEQLGGVPGGSVEEVDGRADVYSLGCVLFEMLAGRPPFPGPGVQAIYSGHLLQPPPDVAELRPDVPADVRAVVARSLAKSPDDRFAGAREMLTALGGARTPPAAPASWARSAARALSGPQHARRRRRLWLAGGLAGAALLGALGFAVGRRPAVPFEARGWVLLADFENATGDSALDRSLSVALSIALQQSAHVNIVPTSRVRELLPRLRRSPTDAVSEPVARDLAQRTGAQFVIAGTASRVGDAYLLSARIVDPVSGNAVATETARAPTRRDVIGALDELSRELRRDLGETRAAIRRRGRPLPLFTTASLDALKHYVQGAEAAHRALYPEAREHYRAALAADSEFVQAHVALGRVAYFQNQRPDGERSFAKALALMDRVSDRERLLFTGDIAEARGEYESARIAREHYVREYPDDVGGWGRLGYANLRLRRCHAAIPAYERAIALASRSEDGVRGDRQLSNYHGNIATCWMVLRRYDRAVEGFRRATALDSVAATAFLTNESYGHSLRRLGRYAEAESVFRLMLAANPERVARGHRSLGLLFAYRGQYERAARHYEESARLSPATSFGVSAYRVHLMRAAAEARRGNDAAAGRAREQAYAIFKTTYIDPIFLSLLGKSLARAGDVRRAQQVLDSVARRANPRAATDLAMLSMLRAEVALARGQREEAVRQAVSAFAADSIDHTLESLAHALAAAGELDAAQVRYERLVDDRDLANEALEYRAQAYYELGRMAETRHDTAAAVRRYSELLELWKEADADLPLLREVRARVASLRPTAPPPFSAVVKPRRPAYATTRMHAGAEG